MKRTGMRIIVIFFLSLLTGCNYAPPVSESSSKDPAAAVYEDTRELMGTVIMVRAYGAHAEEGVEAAFDRAEELEHVFSGTIADSELCIVNEAAQNGTAVSVSEDFCTVLETALMYGAMTDGALDCTMGGLIDLWGIGTSAARLPTEEEIAERLRPNGWRDVTLDAGNRRVTFSTPEVSLHFGAVAKGYISDEMKKTLMECGVESALMSLGGNIMTLGTKPDGGSWKVAITNPFAPDSLIASVHVTDQAAVTSGNYEKYFEQDGVRYHHILDPQTGYPAVSDVVSTTILADCGMDCDALSTATYIMGADKGMELINSLDGIEAVFIKTDGEIVSSAHISDYNLEEISG